MKPTKKQWKELTPKGLLNIKEICIQGGTLAQLINGRFKTVKECEAYSLGYWDGLKDAKLAQKKDKLKDLK